MFRINTVEYGWESNKTAQSGSVGYTTTTKRVYIPETGSRTFLSVVAEMFMRDANQGTTIANMTNAGMSCSIDGNLRGSTHALISANFSAAHTSMRWNRTFTNEFQELFTGSNHSVSFSWINAQTNAGVWIGHGFKLICTYQYDDTNVGTNIKTIRLPIESMAGWIPTTATVFGSSAGGYSNIPALDTFLPEANKKYRDLYLTFDGINAATLTGSVNLIVNIDSGSDDTRYIGYSSMANDVLYYDIYNVSGTMDTATAHALRCRSTTSSRLSDMSPTLFATYEYNGGDSTYIISNMILPLFGSFYEPFNQFSSILAGGCSFLVPETNVSGLLNSAIVVHAGVGYGNNRTITVNGINLFSSHSIIRGGTPSGISNFHYCFGNSAVSSSGYTITSGHNVIPISINNGSIGPQNTSAYVLLTYSGSKLITHENHNRVVCFSSGSFTGPAFQTRQIANRVPTGSIHGSITSSYYMHQPVSIFNGNGTSTENLGININITGSQNLPSTSSKFFNISFGGYGTGRRVNRTFAHTLNGLYGKYPMDSSSATTYFSRNTTTLSNYATTFTNVWNSDYITYNQNIYRITGSLENCANSSDNYQVSIFCSGSNAPKSTLMTLTSTGSGTTKYFMFDWYENITKLYAVSTWPEYAVSNFSTASANVGSLVIDFSSGGGEHSYTFVG